MKVFTKYLFSDNKASSYISLIFFVILILIICNEVIFGYISYNELDDSIKVISLLMIINGLLSIFILKNVLKINPILELIQIIVTIFFVIYLIFLMIYWI